MTKDKNTQQKLPDRFTINSELLNHALGFLSLMPVYQSMELITRINMDIIPVEEVKPEDDMVKPDNVKTVQLNTKK